MSLLRMIGAVAVVVSGIYAAYLFNSGTRQILKQTESFISLLRFLRSQIECFALPLPQALGRCPTEILQGCGYYGNEVPISGKQFISECYISDDHVRRDVERFFSEAGKGYREEQLNLCDYCISLLEERRVSLASQLPMKIKVNSALSIAGAVAVVILLI